MDDKYKEAMGRLRFSEEEQRQILRNLTLAHDGEQTEPLSSVQLPPRATRGGRLPLRYAAACAAALLLVVGIGGGAYASGTLMGVNALIDDLFGGPPAQTQVVDRIGRPIGASASSNGVTITADAIVGDRANYAIVFTISKDDGTAFEGIGALENGLLPLGFSGPSGILVDGMNSANGSSFFYDADPADNAIQYVEKMSVSSDGDNIIGRTAHIELKDLSMFADNGRHIIGEGTWRMKFEIDYEDTSVELASGQEFDLNGMSATIDSASISPIALTLKYTVLGTMSWNGQGSGKLLDHNESQMDRFLSFPIVVNMKDGTIIELNSSDGGGGTQAKGELTSCNKSIMFDTLMDIDAIASVTVNGATIPLLP